jgi:hypothetical protein
MVKQMIVIPIYWGDWWLLARGNAYSAPDVNGLVTKVVQGRYMDGLNQYGFGRGAVSGMYVFQEDPPDRGFGDTKMQWMFKTAIDEGHVPTPDSFDLETQQPFYCLLVKPGIEHLRDATSDGKVPQDTPDVNTGAYHFGFTYTYPDARARWHGQACWVKSDTTATGTVGRLVHEMAEAYSGNSEISDRCQSNAPVLVDGVVVPQYWSVKDNECWPHDDKLVSVAVAEEQAPPSIVSDDRRVESLNEALNQEGPHIGR